MKYKEQKRTKIRQKTRHSSLNEMEPLRKKKKEGEVVVQIANVEAGSGSTRQKKALQQVSKYHEDVCNRFML